MHDDGAVSANTQRVILSAYRDARRECRVIASVARHACRILTNNNESAASVDNIRAVSKQCFTAHCLCEHVLPSNHILDLITPP